MKKVYFGFLTIICLLLSSVTNAQTNYAGTFDGSTSVSIPHNANQVGTAMTFEVWINPASTGGGGANILMKGNYGYGIHL